MRKHYVATLLLALLTLAPLASSCSCGRRRPSANSSSSVSSPKQRHDGRDRRRKAKAASPESSQVTVRQSPAEPATAKLSGSEVFERYNSAVFMVFTTDGQSRSQGSGFFIAPSGVGVSNYHVFEDAYTSAIKLSDGRKYTVSDIIAQSQEDDIIIFRVASGGRTFNHVPISSRQVRVGDKAYAIGSPLGLENTFSSGEVSQIRDNSRHRIQISVPIDHGSSGGVLLNEYGEAIGITTAGIDDSGANLNFAIDIHVISKYINLK